LVEGKLSVQELLMADEVFLTSSVREVMPVATVDGQAIRFSPGPITQRLHRAYQELIEEYIQWATQHHPWQTR
jgi:branched-subunit amino acid aminotransferase/4-amino-4-deoxychorismate lyase